MSDFIIQNPLRLAVALGVNELKDETNLLELVTKLATDNVQLKKDAEIGKQYLADQRKEAIRLATLVLGDGEEGFQINEGMKSMINSADLESVKGLIEHYEKELEKKVPGDPHRSSIEELAETSAGKGLKRTVEVDKNDDSVDLSGDVAKAEAAAKKIMDEKGVDKKTAMKMALSA